MAEPKVKSVRTSQRFAPVLSVLFIVWLLSAPFILPLAVLLLFTCLTLQGRLFAIGVLLIWGGPLLIFRKRSKPFAWIPIISGGGLIVACIFRVSGPASELDKSAASHGGFQSVYSGNAGFRRWSPAQIVPEIDQLVLGSHISPLDPFIDRAQAGRLRRLLLDVYQPMRNDSEFATGGSALGQCYLDMLVGRTETGHRFVYVPTNDGSDKTQSRPMPVILFLHGSMGNFKGYTWVWKQFADANHVAIVVPTFGQGNWHDAGGITEVERTVQAIQDDSRFDSSRIYLAGLSNGARGVTLSIRDFSKHFAGFIYVSPVLSETDCQMEELARHLNSKPVLIISGEDDRRIPANLIRSHIDTLRENSAIIDDHFVPKQDHFLFFADKQLLFNRLQEWMFKPE